MNDEKLRYPVGRFVEPVSFHPEEMKNWINEIENMPLKLRDVVRNFTEEMLDERYRPDGWTARQVIHHVVDSHINAYVRFKLALTEDTPVIKPYFEDRWAMLDDSLNAHPEVSLSLLESLHKRWTLILKKMSVDDFNRCYFHPESKREYSLKVVLAMYAWHSRHHLEHILIVKNKFSVIKS